MFSLVVYFPPIAFPKRAKYCMKKSLLASHVALPRLSASWSICSSATYKCFVYFLHFLSQLDTSVNFGPLWSQKFQIWNLTNLNTPFHWYYLWCCGTACYTNLICEKYSRFISSIYHVAKLKYSSLSAKSTHPIRSGLLLHQDKSSIQLFHFCLVLHGDLYIQFQTAFFQQYCDSTNHFQFRRHLLGLITLFLFEVCSQRERALLKKPPCTRIHTSNFENGVSSTTPRFRGTVLFTHFTSARFSLSIYAMKILKYISNTLQVQMRRGFIDCPQELHRHLAFFQSHIGGWRGT